MTLLKSKINFIFKFILLKVIFSLQFYSLTAQINIQKNFEDSILKLIASSTDEKIIADHYQSISKKYYTINFEKEKEYAKKCFFIAEQTRDKNFICEKALTTVNQYLKIGNIAERNEEVEKITAKVIPIAKDANLHEKVSLFYNCKANIAMTKRDFINAIKFHEEATNYANFSNNDSVQVIVEMFFGETLMTKDENLASFKKFMGALNKAENINNTTLKLMLYEHLGNFYYKIEAKEKAKDFYLKYFSLAKAKGKGNEITNGLRNLISFYGGTKDFESAKNYLQEFKTMGENKKLGNSYDVTRYKMLETNLIFQEDLKLIGAYLQKNPEIFSMLEQWGYTTQSLSGKALMHTNLKNKDSALFYLNKITSSIKENELPNNLMSYNQSFIIFHKEFNNPKEELKYHEKNLALAKQGNSIFEENEIRKNLDSLYIKLNYRDKEIDNKLIMHKLQDSLENETKANDLLNIEIDFENKRLERKKSEETQALNAKHNLQYMGITIGITSLFILLGFFGLFKAKPWLIRAVGFFAFIIFFEFIILIADSQIHHLTHGDPLQILLIKILLIAILLPLHHWVESKVVGYLTRHDKNKNVLSSH